MSEYKYTLGKLEVHNYPYGFKKCTYISELEFNSKKGMRVLTTTINPKTGEKNNPKKGTYSFFTCQYINEEGHIKYGGIDRPFTIEELKKAIERLISFNLKDELTEELIKYIGTEFYIYMKEGLKVYYIKSGSPEDIAEKEKEAEKESEKRLNKFLKVKDLLFSISKTGDYNKFEELLDNLKAIEKE